MQTTWMLPNKLMHIERQDQIVLLLADYLLSQFHTLLREGGFGICVKMVVGSWTSSMKVREKFSKLYRIFESSVLKIKVFCTSPDVMFSRAVFYSENCIYLATRRFLIQNSNFRASCTPAPNTQQQQGPQDLSIYLAFLTAFGPHNHCQRRRRIEWIISHQDSILLRSIRKKESKEQVRMQKFFCDLSMILLPKVANKSINPNVNIYLRSLMSNYQLLSIEIALFLVIV